MNCPLCGDVLADRGFFCKTCAAQIRCKACRETLEPNAVACVECGARVGELPSDGTTAVAADTPLIAHRNTLSYEETRNNRTFSASLTDVAIQGLGEVLGDFFAQRGSSRASSHLGRFGPKELALPPAIAEPVNGNGYHDAGVLPPSEPEPPSDMNRISRIFSLDGETLELKDNRIKAKSQLDFVRRLTYLFLYAHELHGRLPESYDALRKVMQVAKVWDANTRTWLAKRNGFTADAEDRLKLNAPGREAAITALGEALNPDVPDEWNPDKKVPRKLSPRKKA